MIVKLKAPQGTSQISYGQATVQIDQDGYTHLPGYIAQQLVPLGFEADPAQFDTAIARGEAPYALLAYGAPLDAPAADERSIEQRATDLLAQRGTPRIVIM